MLKDGQNRFKLVCIPFRKLYQKQSEIIAVFPLSRTPSFKNYSLKMMILDLIHYLDFLIKMHIPILLFNPNEVKNNHGIHLYYNRNTSTTICRGLFAQNPARLSVYHGFNVDNLPCMWVHGGRVHCV